MIVVPRVVTMIDLRAVVLVAEREPNAESEGGRALPGATSGDPRTTRIDADVYDTDR